jgi:hypothetical protein
MPDIHHRVGAVRMNANAYGSELELTGQCVSARLRLASGALGGVSGE